jgi:hypothetical protein
LAVLPIDPGHLDESAAHCVEQGLLAEKREQRSLAIEIEEEGKGKQYCHSQKAQFAGLLEGTIESFAGRAPEQKVVTA